MAKFIRLVGLSCTCMWDKLNSCAVIFRSSEILADENREICREKVKFLKFSTVWKFFENRGETWNRGKCIMASEGMDAPDRGWYNEDIIWPEDVWIGLGHNIPGYNLALAALTPGINRPGYILACYTGIPAVSLWTRVWHAKSNPNDQLEMEDKVTSLCSKTLRASSFLAWAVISAVTSTFTWNNSK